MPTLLTNAFVDTLTHPETGQIFYRDADLKGFGLRVGTGRKVYIAEGKVDNKTVRVTIGRHGKLTAEQARAQAQTILSMMQRGIHPNALNAPSKAESVTLGQVYQAYLAARPDLKPRTLYDYNRLMSTHFEDWSNKPIIEISQDDIARKHKQIGANSSSQANLAMRFISALFNFAIQQQTSARPKFLNNPIKRLTPSISGYAVERRQSIIPPDQLSAWLKAVHILPTISNGANKEAVKDYLLLLIFTGLQREEGLALQWRDIDFKAKTLTITAPTAQAILTLPLSTFLYYLLKKRHEDNPTLSPFVFPGTGSKGHMDDPAKQIKIITQASGIRFTPQDLRRTFSAIAESLNIPISTFSWLSHQKVSINTAASYAVNEPDRVKQAMQKVTDYLMSQTLKA